MSQDRDNTITRRNLLKTAGVGTVATLASAVPAEVASTDDSQVESQLREVPSDYDAAYVKNVIVPFLRTNIYEVERPAVPMIDVLCSKELSVAGNIAPLLYDSWQPDPEGEGVTVFIQGLEKRGPDNLRKKIYVSAVTPDLYAPMYAGKFKAFFDSWLGNRNTAQPLMALYNDGYLDLYWDLHLGVKGADVPKEIRDFCNAFNVVLAYQDPRQRLVYENYMKVRELRKPLREWIDTRLKDIASGKIPNSEGTFAYYWIKNGADTGHFRDRDVVFECFHNLTAISQWGGFFYIVMEKLEEEEGDPAVRAVFKKTMEGDYDNAGGAAFTPLDRFVMELFRTIPFNPGSTSAVKDISGNRGDMVRVRTSHMLSNLDPRHWEKAEDFNPDRYLSVPASNKVDKSRALEMGFATSPFDSVPFSVKDGRKAEVTNSAFGAVYGVVDGKPLPVCDYAGYAPFGFGYRRCAGELLTIFMLKDFLRKVWNEKISFHRLKTGTKQLAVGVRVITDDIVLSRRA